MGGDEYKLTWMAHGYNIINANDIRKKMNAMSMKNYLFSR